MQATTTTTTTNNARINPTLSDTLAIWAARTIFAPATVKQIVGFVAKGHPAGVRHCSVGIHRSNTSELVRTGALVAAGDLFGQPLYRAA